MSSTRALIVGHIGLFGLPPSTQSKRFESLKEHNGVDGCLSVTSRR